MLACSVWSAACDSVSAVSFARTASTDRTRCSEMSPCRDLVTTSCRFRLRSELSMLCAHPDVCPLTPWSAARLWEKSADWSRLSPSSRARSAALSARPESYLPSTFVFTEPTMPLLVSFNAWLAVVSAVVNLLQRSFRSLSTSVLKAWSCWLRAPDWRFASLSTPFDTSCTAAHVAEKLRADSPPCSATPRFRSWRAWRFETAASCALFVSAAILVVREAISESSSERRLPSAASCSSVARAMRARSCVVSVSTRELSAVCACRTAPSIWTRTAAWSSRRDFASVLMSVWSSAAASLTLRLRSLLRFVVSETASATLAERALILASCAVSSVTSVAFNPATWALRRCSAAAARDLTPVTFEDSTATCAENAFWIAATAVSMSSVTFALIPARPVASPVRIAEESWACAALIASRSWVTEVRAAATASFATVTAPPPAAPSSTAPACSAPAADVSFAFSASHCAVPAPSSLLLVARSSPPAAASATCSAATLVCSPAAARWRCATSAATCLTWRAPTAVSSTAIPDTDALNAAAPTAIAVFILVILSSRVLAPSAMCAVIAPFCAARASEKFWRSIATPAATDASISAESPSTSLETAPERASSDAPALLSPCLRDASASWAEALDKRTEPSSCDTALSTSAWSAASVPFIRLRRAVASAMPERDVRVEAVRVCIQMCTSCSIWRWNAVRFAARWIRYPFAAKSTSESIPSASSPASLARPCSSEDMAAARPTAPALIFSERRAISISTCFCSR
mmetsp:Transcript_62954/g.150108  ORF Transcript_62954/g.150108 Transcript_62954/m.150108 type:complete len:753 (+) Transcript_62954:328-2586(+)